MTALMAEAAGAGSESLAVVEVQAPIADAGLADLVLTFEGGKRAIVDVQVETALEAAPVPAFTEVGEGLTTEAPALVVLGLNGQAP